MSILLVVHVPASCVFVLLVVNLVPAHACMAMVYAKNVSASAAAACRVAFASSIDAHVAIAAYFTRFAEVAMIVAFGAFLADFALLILSCLTNFASAAAKSMFASRLALRSMCC